METVRVFTAERMQAIEDGAVVSGVVVGDNLILTKHDGSTLNAGSVRGAPGPVGSSPIVCTSTTRPTIGLYHGLVIYETDTDRTYMYDGTDWRSWEPMRICTSTTHPPLPFEGLEIYETDTHQKLIYNGVYFSKPWNEPWGGVAGAGVACSWGTAEVTSTYNPGPVSFVAPGNRRYLVKLNAGVYRSGDNGWDLFKIKRNGITIRSFTPSNVFGTGSDDRYSFVEEYQDIPPAGTVTYTVTAQAYTGSHHFDPAVQNTILTVADAGSWGPPV